jgi:hypothetical protein
MSQATLLYHRKRLYDNGAIAELKLWLVPRTVPGSKHSYKYSLYYGRHGKRLIGYDNETAKAIIATMAISKRSIASRRRNN